MKTLLSRAALAAAAMALGLSGAHATFATATLTAKLNVLEACTVTADSNLDFGDRFATAATYETSTKVHISCAASNPILYLKPSNSYVNGHPSMNSGANSVQYDLYTATGGDSANLWPSTGQSVSSGDVTIYGRATLTGTTPPGTYTDIVTVSLLY